MLIIITMTGVFDDYYNDHDNWCCQLVMMTGIDDVDGNWR